VVDKYRSPHLWEKSEGIWKLKHPIWQEEKCSIEYA
jgi:hypothetical protein